MGKVGKKKVILEKKINEKKRGGKLKKKKWKKKKKEECPVDYCCNPQCIGCGWTVNSPHPLGYCLISWCYNYNYN
jgi:hypothetical protein